MTDSDMEIVAVLTLPISMDQMPDIHKLMTSLYGKGTGVTPARLGDKPAINITRKASACPKP